MSDFTTHYLANYQKPPFVMGHVELLVEIKNYHAQVTLQTTVTRNTPTHKNCFLNGKNIEIISIEVDEKPLPPKQFRMEKEGLWLDKASDKFSLKIVQTIDYLNNKTLEGLYQSGDIICTHCEPDGFSRITYFIDRPDHLTTFNTTIIANKKHYPEILCNGNCVEQKTLKNGLHQVTFDDPFKKPAYLFALVLGKLQCIKNEFISAIGKPIALKLYRQAGGDLTQLHHGLASLKQAMQFDERVFGLSYELEQYLIVAIDDFNSGAMENKGLNLFNTRYVLADPALATDTDYQNVRAVVGHEYFHNWTGNRVTCRDWFQLSLKEGLTVLREQLFMEDQLDPVLARIDQVELLRTHQFVEDKSALAHPVRPSSFIEVDNFYTTTVYEKGAEIIRMIKCVIGDDHFFKGITHYLQKHDGSAATVEDLIESFGTVSKIDLSSFLHWYNQVGTPSVELESEFNKKNKTFTLHIKQKDWDQKNQTPPLWIPVQISLQEKTGKCLPLVTTSQNIRLINSQQAILNLRSEKESFTFSHIASPPMLSYLQSFSAPVHASYTKDTQHLTSRILTDTDPFNRYDQMQNYYTQHLKKMVEAGTKVPDEIIEIIGTLFEQLIDQPGFLSRLLRLPSDEQLLIDLNQQSVQAICHAKQLWKSHIAKHLKDQLYEKYTESEQYALDHQNDQSAHHRALRGEILNYLACSHQNTGKEQALAQYSQANNLTERLSALNALIAGEYGSDQPSSLLDDLLANFHKKAQNEMLLVNRYFRLQANRRHHQNFEMIQSLTQHPQFSFTNPNCVYALLGTWVNNLYSFHFLSKNGAHHQWLAKQIIELDQINPSVATYLMSQAFSMRKYHSQNTQQYIQQTLNELAQHTLSKQLYESFQTIQNGA